MLSYRSEIALQGALVFAKSRRLELGDFREKKRKISAITVFKVIQGHRDRYQSKARMRFPISH